MSSPAAHAATHAVNPFVGSAPYLNPNYVSEVDAQASADGGSLGAAETNAATYQTAIWLDHIGAIAGDSTHLGLQAQLDSAAAQAQTSASPVLFEIVLYDLPGRDCAAAAPSGEIPATTAGLTEYESQFIDPIAALLGNAKYANLRIVALIEPDSLPNAVTNLSKPACTTAVPLYEQGIDYALNKLHAILNVYNYLDIARSPWLGYTSNTSAAVPEYADVVKATTAGYASVDGFVSDIADYTPVQEPFLPNPLLAVGGMPIEAASFYEYNPTFDEYTYDTRMYNSLIAAGFPSSIGFVIDTSRDGWGGPSRPTALNSSPTTASAYVMANKIDLRPFRGASCNQFGAGIGARPQALPFGAGSPIVAFVWAKAPGESDGDYPTSTHPHGDPTCDPNGTISNGGVSYPTGSFPGYDIPAGQWFGAEFQQLVRNAYPALGTISGDTTPPSTPMNLAVSSTTSSSVTLTWAASTDNVGVAGYRIYRGTTLAGLTTTGTSFTDTGLNAATQYSYTVAAFDAAGNVSPQSTPVSATTAVGVPVGGCTAKYQVTNDWGTGFTANITVTNTGSTATTAWTVTWTWAGNQLVTNFWNAGGQQRGQNVTAMNLSYDGALAPGASTSFGIQASYSGSNPAPTLTCTAS